MDWISESMGEFNGLEFQKQLQFRKRARTEIVCLDTNKKDEQSTGGGNVNILHVRKLFVS